MSNIIKISNELVSATNTKYDVLEKIKGDILPPGLSLIPYRKGRKWGFCDKRKNIIIPCIYDSANTFSEGLAKVSLNGKFYFLNEKGEVVIRLDGYNKVNDFRDGLALVRRKNKNGFIDKKGNFCIDLMYDYTRPFVNGVTHIRINGKMGFINTHGEIIIKPIYDNVTFFNESLAAVQLNGKWGFIDKKGKYNH